MPVVPEVIPIADLQVERHAPETRRLAVATDVVCGKAASKAFRVSVRVPPDTQQHRW